GGPRAEDQSRRGKQPCDEIRVDEDPAPDDSADHHHRGAEETQAPGKGRGLAQGDCQSFRSSHIWASAAAVVWPPHAGGAGARRCRRPVGGDKSLTTPDASRGWRRKAALA